MERNNAKVIIKPEVAATINELHRRVGRCEWSGVMFYTVDDEYARIEDKTYYLEKICLMDIGTVGATDFEYDSKPFKRFIRKHEDVFFMKQGLIHTHHNMGAYFSGTDETELVRNTKNHNYYLSVVVAFDCKPAIVITQLRDGEIVKVTPTIEYDCDVIDEDIFSELNSKRNDSRNSVGLNRVNVYSGFGNPYNTRDVFNIRTFVRETVALILSSGATSNIAEAVYKHYMRTPIRTRGKHIRKKDVMGFRTLATSKHVLRNTDMESMIVGYQFARKDINLIFKYLRS